MPEDTAHCAALVAMIDQYYDSLPPQPVAAAPASEAAPAAMEQTAAVLSQL